MLPPVRVTVSVTGGVPSAVAAVAATSEAVAAEALKLIQVEYEVLPHVLDVAQAMQPDAPLLHEDMYTIGMEPRPAKPSNVAKRVEFALGDVAAGFAKAMDISCHSFIRMARRAAPLMTEGGTMFAMSYHGAQKVVPNYNVMGPVKAALEAACRYLAYELGPKRSACTRSRRGRSRRARRPASRTST